MRKNDAIALIRALIRWKCVMLNQLDVQPTPSNAGPVATASVGISYAMAVQIVSMAATKNAR